MTRSKAADIAQALTNLGYPVTVIPSPLGDITSGWSVKVQVPLNLTVTAAVVASFSAAQGVTDNVLSVCFL